MARLPGVRTGRSAISLPDSRSLHLDAGRGPATAFAPDGTEFAHLHGRRDSSLHLFLREPDAAHAVQQGWGVYHPVVTMGLYPPTLIMIYGPRDLPELDIVFGIVQASYTYAHGDRLQG
jgi:phospholipase/carboxylesterase